MKGEAWHERIGFIIVTWAKRGRNTDHVMRKKNWYLLCSTTKLSSPRYPHVTMVQQWFLICLQCHCLTFCTNGTALRVGSWLLALVDDRWNWIECSIEVTCRRLVRNRYVINHLGAFNKRSLSYIPDLSWTRNYSSLPLNNWFINSLDFIIQYDVFQIFHPMVTTTTESLGLVWLQWSDNPSIILFSH